MGRSRNTEILETRFIRTNKNKLDWHLLEKVGAFLIKHSPNRFPKYEAISGENTKGETLLFRVMSYF